MGGRTLTLRLVGEVPLNLFAQAMDRFQRLVAALSQEVGGQGAIVWIVDELAAGSAVVTVRGEAEAAEDVERVERAYAAVGRALERHEPIPYSPAVATAARALTSVLDGAITSLWLETETEAATVAARAPDERQVDVSAFGAIEGRIETLRSRHRLSFTLYDALNDEAVDCRLRPDQADLVRAAWGKRVLVAGVITREPVRGRPIAINPVESIEILPEVVPGSYRRARAVAPAPPGSIPPAETIRRWRDA